MNVMDPEVWESDYKETFFGDPRILEMRREAKERIKPKAEGEAGSFVIERPEGWKPASRAEGFTVNIGGSDKGKSGSGPSITPSDDGSLEVE